MASPAAVLSILVTANTDKAVADLAKVNAAAEKSGKSADAMAAKHKRSSEQIKRAAGLTALGFGIVGAAAIKTAADYEQSMNTLQAVTRATGQEMDRLGKLAIKLGADTKLPGTSAKDAAEAMTEMSKAGVSLKDTMAGVRDVLVLSAAAGVSNAEAAEIAANALNAFGLKGKDVKMVTDQLANTANASSVEIRDVADSMKMAAAVFSSFQGPVVGAKGALTELNVAVGLLGNAGIKGSDAGTSLKQMLLQLTGPSDKAKDAMRGLYVAAKDAGTSQGKLNDIIHGSGKVRNDAIKALNDSNTNLGAEADIAYDAAGKMRSLHDIIALVAKGTKDMTQQQRNAYLTQIFGADATRAVLILMKQQEHGWGKMEKAVTRQGAAQELANAKMKGFKGSLEALKSSLETLAIVVGTKLLPALTAIASGFASMLGSLDPTVLMIYVGALGALAAAVWAVNVAMAANPVVLLAAALATLGFALVVAYQKVGAFRTAVDAGFGAIKTAAGAVRDAMVAAVAWVKQAMSAVSTEFHKWDVAAAVVRTAVTAILAVLGPALAVIKNMMSTEMQLILIGFRMAWQIATAVVSGAFKALKAIVSGGLQAIHGVIEVIGGVFKGDFGQIWKGIKDIFGGAIKALKGLLLANVSVLAGAAKAIGGGIKDALVSAFRGAANTVIDFINAIIKAINALPFLPDIKIIGKIGGKAADVSAGKGGGGFGATFARGGAYARTGGLVQKPMVLMGEEAPRFPEFVIPTNPAYRGRAKGLLAAAAGQIGFARGGWWSTPQLEKLWNAHGGNPAAAHTMAIIAEAESGSIQAGRANQFARNPSGATGLWQILGQVVPGDLTNAVVNVLNAISKSSNGRNLHPWDASRSAWGPWVTGAGAGPGGGNFFAAIGGILDKLPGVGDLPDFFEPMGKGILGAATKWIKKQVGKLAGSGKSSLATLENMATGFGLRITSTTDGHHVAGSYHYLGRAFDAADGANAMAAFARYMAENYGANLTELFYDPLGYYIKNGQRVTGAIGGHSDHVHVALRKGGIYGGEFRDGGIVPGPAGAPRVILAHAGEMVLPMANGNVWGGWRAPTSSAWGGSLGAAAAPPALTQALTTALRAIGQKSPKARKDAVSKLRDAIKAAGFPASTARALQSASDTFDMYGDYADNASTLSTTDAEGNTIPGEFRGKTQPEWLNEQLNAAMAWRNQLIKARQWVAEQIPKVQAAIDKARKRLAGIQTELRKLERTRGELTKTLEKLEKHPKTNKLHIERVKSWIDTIDKVAMPPLKRQEKALDGSDGIIAKLVAKRDAVKQVGKDSLSNLEDLQGAGSPMDLMASLPDIGTLGGKILKIQAQYRDLTAEKPTATPAVTAAAAGAQEIAPDVLQLMAELRGAKAWIKELEFERLHPLPRLAAGGFAPGGWALVGERGPELAALPGGTRVYSNQQSSQMLSGQQITVVVQDGAVDPNKIRVIAGQEAQVVMRRESRYGARALPGRGGGIQ